MPEKQQSEARYEFGPFVLDPGAHVLLRQGKLVALTPKAFEALLVLVRHQGKLLSKDELYRSLWPETCVEENNLTQYVSMLRKALGENGNGAKYIETIPRLGYRFIADVREVDRERGATLTPRAGVTRSRGLIVITLLLLGLILLTIYWRWSLAKAPAVSAGTQTLAVLPLRNLKPDPDTDFLSMALADAIINRLGYVGELTVQPFSAVAKYRNSEADPREVARALNVKNLLAGSYVREGDELRVTTELISVDKSASPWRDNIELKYDKLLTVQDRVAISVIHSMGLELQPEEAEQIKKDLPTNPVAYESYLRGIDKGMKSDFQAAMKLLEKSVALEPGNARAWAELAMVYLAYARVQGGETVYVDKGWDAFHRAVELGAGNRVIVDMMAFQLIENNRADEAIPLLRESLRHNATDSFAHWYLSEAYRYGGALQQSLAEGELALRLNPLVGENMTFNTYLYVGDYRKFLNSLPPDEENARNLFYRGLANDYLNDTTRAEQEFDRAFELNPALLHSQIGRALTYALHHRDTQGLQLMGKVERVESTDGEMVYKMAQAYAQLGDKASSLRLLRRSIELNFYPYSYFSRDPLLEPVRSEPDYSAVMELARQRQQTFLKRFF